MLQYTPRITLYNIFWNRQLLHIICPNDAYRLAGKQSKVLLVAFLKVLHQKWTHSFQWYVLQKLFTSIFKCFKNLYHPLVFYFSLHIFLFIGRFRFMMIALRRKMSFIYDLASNNSFCFIHSDCYSRKKPFFFRRK